MTLTYSPLALYRLHQYTEKVPYAPVSQVAPSSFNHKFATRCQLQRQYTELLNFLFPKTSPATMDLSLLGPGPGPGLDAEQASVRQEVVKLITLLDRYLFLRGDTLTSYDAHFPSIPAREFSDAIPVSLQYFPPVSLASHLEKQAGEKAEMQNLTAHIVATCLDPRVTKLAKLQVMEAYAYLSPANDR